MLNESICLGVTLTKYGSTVNIKQAFVICYDEQNELNHYKLYFVAQFLLLHKLLLIDRFIRNGHVT